MNLKFFVMCFIVNAINAQNYMMQRQEILPPMLIPIMQYETHFSGPAIADAVLRYWQLPPVRLGIQTEDGLQRLLARDEFMKSDLNGGTSPDDWVQTVNHFVSKFKLNDQRQYSRVELAAGYSNLQDFYEIVTKSLEKNVPVALSFISQAQEAVSTYGPRYNFIMITSIAGVVENAVYTYIDPNDGVIRQFDNSFLSFLSASDNSLSAAMPCFILAHIDPSDPNFTNINNQMQSPNKCSFLSTMTSVCQNLDRNKRSAFRAQTCMAVDAVNPMTNYADYIYIMQRLIGRNGIQLKLSRSTAMTLERFFMENDRATFMRYTEALLVRITQKGTVLDTDRTHAANNIYDGMPYIHERILALLRDDDIRPIFIQTYRAYNFHETLKSIGVDNTVYVSDHPKQ